MVIEMCSLPAGCVWLGKAAVGARFFFFAKQNEQTAMKLWLCHTGRLTQSQKVLNILKHDRSLVVKKSTHIKQYTDHA